MDQQKTEAIVTKLKDAGIVFEKRLSEPQIREIEVIGEFQFPPDLKAFLQYAVPIDRADNEAPSSFPNWHDNPQKIVDDAWDWTIGTFTFDIEHSNFWMDEWGTKPTTLDDALNVVTDYLATVPKLIPIYAHRFMPSEPVQAGNPVYSIYQAVDSVVYGVDLEHYLTQEFLISAQQRFQDDINWSNFRSIRFWDKIVRE